MSFIFFRLEGEAQPKIFKLESTNAKLVNQLKGIKIVVCFKFTLQWYIKKSKLIIRAIIYLYHETFVPPILEAEDDLAKCKMTCVNLEKSKERSLNDIAEINLELEQSGQKSSRLEKRIHHYENTILEWKNKADDLKLELTESRKCEK